MAGFINFGNNAAQSGFQNALQMGLQFGQQAAEGANRRGFNNALANVDLSNPDSIKEVTRFRPEVGIQLQQQAQQQQAAARKAEQDAIPIVLNMLKAAKNNPEQYGAILARAQQLGIPGIENAPQQFDPNWIDSQITTLSAFATPQGREALSTAGKEAVDAGFQPGTPEFAAEVRRRLQAGDKKTIPFQPGGGIIEYDPATGETRILAGPSGSPSAVQVPPPPEGFTLDGDVSGNAGGGF